MTISIDTRVKPEGDVLFQEVQGDAVLLDLRSGVYFGLDHVATRMWQLMGEGSTLSAVARQVCEEFDVPEEKCAEDVVALASRLSEEGLITICSQ
jgi:hypothetical protein